MSVDHRWREQVNELAREHLARDGTLRVRIVTTSMSPLIREGETIVLQQTNVNSFALGDIILFRQGEMWLAHRLVARTSEGKWITKGDRAPSCDRMEIDDWIGRVVAVENTTRRFDLGRASYLARLIAFLSFRAARAEEENSRGRARLMRVLTRFAARSVRVLAATARNV